MSVYNPPIKDILFNLQELAEINSILELPAYKDLDQSTLEQVIIEAGIFAKEIFSPLNVSGDIMGCSVNHQEVIIPDGFIGAYKQFVEDGWQSVSDAPKYGGMGLPEAVSVGITEMWHASNMSLAVCPLLTSGAITAILKHASDDLKNKFLPKMIQGEWSGTMLMTESQAGSDLSGINTRAVRDGDVYRISGTKIYITWGDHSMSKNIVHLVLARLPDAPDGVRGISMFLVPKFLVNEDGSLGDRNNIFPLSVEHKLGINGSPTCVMQLGENKGAIGYLLGSEHSGLSNMFTMMNHARLQVGVQGLGVSESAYQLAKKHALERTQGYVVNQNKRVTIINHPDVRRMLLLMKSQVEAMRGAAYWTGRLMDLDHHMTSNKKEWAQSQLALLTPIIKGWLTETAQEITSLGIQIHGGMGFVEETGAAQFFRDARILTIYEGTTGIQANDFVYRKILADDGNAVRDLLKQIRITIEEMESVDKLVEMADQLKFATENLEEVVNWICRIKSQDPSAAASASFNLLMLAGTLVGGWHMAKAAIAVNADKPDFDDVFKDSKIKTAKFYFSHVLPRTYSYKTIAMTSSSILTDFHEEQI